MKKLLTLVLAALLCTAALTAQSHRPHPNSNAPAPIRNGLWWQDKSGLYKEAFIGGYKAASERVAGHSMDVNKFPASELIDGLDHFYKDFRNRNIYVDDALPFVAEQLRGVPDDKLNAELLHLRAAAAPPPESVE